MGGSEAAVEAGSPGEGGRVLYWRACRGHERDSMRSVKISSLVTAAGMPSNFRSRPCCLLGLACAPKNLEECLQ